MLTLAVVDDYPLVVAGLRSVLEPHARRVHLVEGHLTYDTARDVDVVLHDPYTGPHSGSPDPRAVLGRPRAKLVVFSWRSEPHLVASALADGADGFLAKSSTAEEVVDAVERVSVGERVRPALPPDAPDEQPWRGAEHGLSVRESEVLAQVCLGKGNREIADGCYLSINTVKTYIRSAYRKIGATTRPQAVIWALEHGFDSSSSQWGASPTLHAVPSAVLSVPRNGRSGYRPGASAPGVPASAGPGLQPQADRDHNAAPTTPPPVTGRPLECTLDRRCGNVDGWTRR